MDLFSPVTALKGVGAVRAKQLAKLHIETLYDLIAFFPRDYEDRTKLCSIAGLKPGEPACFEAMVISNPQLSRIRKGMELVKVRVADETGRVDLVFFNQPYVKDQLNYGESYRFYGALREGYGHQMQNPAFELLDAAGAVTGRILHRRHHQQAHRRVRPAGFRRVPGFSSGHSAYGRADPLWSLLRALCL